MFFVFYWPSTIIVFVHQFLQATESGSITLSVGPENIFSQPEPGQPCQLVFKVVDTGKGFGNINPQRLLQQFYHQPNFNTSLEEGSFTKSVCWYSSRCCFLTLY